MTHAIAAGLAATANEEHRAAQAAAASALEHARNAGEALNEAKAAVGHGAWGAWVEEHFEGSARTARIYQRIAREWEAIPNRQRAAELSLRGAVRLLQDAKRENDRERRAERRERRASERTPEKREMEAAVEAVSEVRARGRAYIASLERVFMDHKDTLDGEMGLNLAATFVEHRVILADNLPSGFLSLPATESGGRVIEVPAERDFFDHLLLGLAREARSKGIQTCIGSLEGMVEVALGEDGRREFDERLERLGLTAETIALPLRQRRKRFVS